MISASVKQLPPRPNLIKAASSHHMLELTGNIKWSYSEPVTTLYQLFWCDVPTHPHRWPPLSTTFNSDGPDCLFHFRQRQETCCGPSNNFLYFKVKTGTKVQQEEPIIHMHQTSGTAAWAWSVLVENMLSGFKLIILPKHWFKKNK